MLARGGRLVQNRRVHAGATSREGSDRCRVVACRAIAAVALVLAWIGVFAHVARANTVVIGETTLAPNGRTGVALSPVVKLRGPVANL